ncbi:hypothetical protein J6590_105363 [Homalodisca vitripennis]|nr:hypothetical protein J6590_105363 [Homalodisca vitripennis]
MRIPLYLDCTTFCSLGFSDVERMLGIRLERLRSSSSTIFDPSKTNMTLDFRSQALQQHQILDTARKRQTKLRVAASCHSQRGSDYNMSADWLQDIRPLIFPDWAVASI